MQAYNYQCNTDCCSRRGLRSYVHRQLLSLTKKGYLIKEGKKNTQKVRYIRTELFRQDFNCEYLVLDTELEKINLISLANRLENYEQRVISSSAEVEEYERYIQSYPFLGEILSTKLVLARAKKYQSLGRLNALENILDKCNK